jgi:hypothetical protein
MSSRRLRAPQESDCRHTAKRSGLVALAVDAFIRDHRAAQARASFKVIDGGCTPEADSAAFRRLGLQLAMAPSPEGFASVARLLAIHAR